MKTCYLSISIFRALPQMLIHLHTNPSFFSLNNSINVKRENYKVLFGLKKIRRINKAVDKDSEFEVDPDSAREALRKLDQQLQSLSSKQPLPTSPKIRAPNYNQLSSQTQEEGSEISGSFWAYAVSLLLLFTIFYNILFLTVIKPSIDGPEPVESSEAYDMK